MSEIYYVKRVQNCRVVPLPEPLPHRRWLSITLLAALWFAAAVFFAWQRFAGVQDGYRLETLQQEKQQTLEENRKLRLEVASLGAPVRIDTIARQELGMTTLSPHQIFAAEPLTTEPALAAVAKVRPGVEPLPSPARNVAAIVR